MRLDKDEKIVLEATPDKRILIVWFFTKTITYSIAMVFFAFMVVFFTTVINDIDSIDKKDKTETLENKNSIEETTDVKDKDNNISHPFFIFIDYWKWALILVIATAIAIQIYFVFLRKTYRYIVTNRRCIFIGGILKRVERTIPYKKITDIQRSQNILERILGIWNVQVFTPGTASVQFGQAKMKAELNYDGLVNSEEVYETLSRYTQVSG